MNDKRQIHRTDLTIVEVPVIEVEQYLMNETIHWLIAKQERYELSMGKPIHITARVSYVM